MYTSQPEGPPRLILTRLSTPQVLLRLLAVKNPQPDHFHVPTHLPTTPHTPPYSHHSDFTPNPKMAPATQPQTAQPNPSSCTRWPRRSGDDENRDWRAWATLWEDAARGPWWPEGRDGCGREDMLGWRRRKNFKVRIRLRRRGWTRSSFATCAEEEGVACKGTRPVREGASTIKVRPFQATTSKAS